jgi:prepilin-type processing-associated H-X9-DG protein
MSYPGSYHNGAGNFSYADGHVEEHPWLNPRTRPPLHKDQRLPIEDPKNGFPSPGDSDVRWLQERTFQRGD